MKHMIIFLASLVFTVYAQAQTEPVNDGLTTVVGTLPDDLSIQIDPVVAKHILDSYADMSHLPHMDVNIASLMRPGDEAAISAATAVFQLQYKNAAIRILEMKGLAYELDALKQTLSGQRFHKSLFGTTIVEFHGKFRSLIQDLNTPKIDARAAMRLCHSKFCIVNIAKAMEDIVMLSYVLNYGLSVSDAYKLNIQESLTPYSIYGLMDGVDSAGGDDEKAYYATLQAILYQVQDPTKLSKHMMNVSRQYGELRTVKVKVPCLSKQRKNISRMVVEELQLLNARTTRTEEGK